MATCLVTGGAGFLGSHLCDELLRRDHRVICVDNFETGSLANIEHIRTPDFVHVHHDIIEPFYVDEPDIPVGMTCATWRRGRRPGREPGLFARVRVRRVAVLCMRSLGLASTPNSAID